MKVRVLIFVLILLIFFVVCGYFLGTSQTTLFSQISISLISSLSASIVFALILIYFIGEPLMGEHVHLKSLLEELKNRDLSGVVSIRAKDKYEPQFWVDLLGSTNSELILSGHSLSNWIDEPFVYTFITNLKRIAKNGGNVKLLIMKPEASSTQRLINSTGDYLNQKIQKTIDLIRDEIVSKLPEKSKKNIELRCLDDLELPYIFNKNDNHVLISPYLTRSPNRRNLLIILQRDSEYAVTYTNDFNELWNSNLTEEIPLL